MASSTEVSADVLAPLTPEELRKVACLLAKPAIISFCGLIYLRANPLLGAAESRGTSRIGSSVIGARIRASL